MKIKLFSFVTALLLFVTFPFMASASSSGLDIPHFDVLAVSMPDNNNNLFASLTPGKIVTFDLPYAIPCFDYDLLISTDAQNLQINLINSSGTSYPATVEKIDTNLYRVYGSLLGTGVISFKLQFNFTSGTGVWFKSFKAWTLKLDNYTPSASGFIDFSGTGALTPGPSYTYDGSRITWTKAGTSEYQNFTFNCEILNWEKYDFITIYGVCNNVYLNSVTLDFPFPVKMYTNGFHPVYTADSDLGYYVTFDLRDVPRDTYKNDNFYIYFYGSYAGEETVFKLNGINGYVVSNTDTFWSILKSLFTNLTNKLSGWFNTNFAWLENIYNAIVGNHQSGSADDFASEMESQGSELDQMVDDMTAATLPDIDDIEIDISDMDADFSNAGDILSAPLRNELIFRVFYVAATFALAGYVLYGKR